MKHLIAILFTACAFAQTGSWPTVATDADLIVAKTGATSTLSTGINASTLTVVVADGSKFAQYSVIRIDDEYMQICSIATNTLTICNGTRGLVGSAASHLAGVTVRDVVSEYHHNRLRVEIKAMQTKLLPATSGTTAPGTCAANRELFVDRDASPNPTLHLCNPTGDGWLDIAGGGSGSADPPYTATVSAQTSVTVTAATHGQGTLATAACFDDSTPRQMVGCTYTRAVNGDIAFAFSPAFTGLIQIGAGGGGAGDNLGTADAAAVVALFSGSGDYLKTDGTKGTPSGVPYTIGPSGILSLDGSVLDGDPAVVCRKGDVCAPTGLQDWSGAAGIIAKEGTPASLTATCTKGTVVYDSAFVHVCVATNTWRTAPLTNFSANAATVPGTWRNQGTATVSTGAYSQLIKRPNVNGGGPLMVGREITMPSTPYTITVNVDASNVSDWGSSGHGFGLYVADNSTGRVHFFNFAPNGGSIYRSDWTSATTYASTQTALCGATYNGHPWPRWFQLYDNGTNIQIRWSHNGDAWIDCGSAFSRTTWAATPDRVGVAVAGGNGNYDSYLTINQWRQQ